MNYKPEDILNFDQEALNRTYEQIHYYSCLPKQIKRTAVNMTSSPYYLTNDGINDPAYIVDGTTTVKAGKINIPSVC